MRDEKRTQEILEDISTSITEHLSDYPEMFAKLAECLLFEPPTLHEIDENSMGLITVLSMGRGGGYSKKSGNLIVNFKQAALLSGVATSAGVAATQAGSPSAIAFFSALLALCLRLSRLEKIVLDPEHALGKG